MNQSKIDYKIQKYNLKIKEYLDKTKIINFKKKLNYYTKLKNSLFKEINLQIGDKVKIINSTYTIKNSICNSFIGSSGIISHINDIPNNKYIGVKFADGSYYSFNTSDLELLSS